MLGGERHADGRYAYSESLCEPTRTSNLFRKIIGKNTGKRGLLPTDAGEQIGSLVHGAGLGNRLNQIYCDSTQWETSAYPDGFFDSILIDGGHQSAVVASDTLKSIRLVRQGGVILWHDFCLDEQVRQKFKHVETVIQGVESVAADIHRHGIRLYWINPSWLLCGIKGNVPVPTAKG